MNSGAFNRQMFAGIAGAILAFAGSAALTAEATITANPINELAGNAALVATADWSADTEQFRTASWSLNSTTEFGGKPWFDYAGKTTWSSSLTLSGYVLRYVEASGDWLTASDIEFVPYQKFGFVAFTGTGDFDGELQYNHTAKGLWPASLTWAAENLSVDRRSTAEWQGGSVDLLAEPRHFVAAEGVYYHTATVRGVTANASFSEDQSKVRIVVPELGDSLIGANATTVFNSTLNQVVKTAWLSGANSYFYPNRVTFNSGAWMSTETGLSGDTYVIQQSDTLSFSASSTFNSGAVVQHTATGPFGSGGLNWAADSIGRYAGNSYDWKGSAIQNRFLGGLLGNARATWVLEVGLFVQNDRLRISKQHYGTVGWSGNTNFNVSDSYTRISHLWFETIDWSVKASPYFFPYRTSYTTASWGGVGTSLSSGALLSGSVLTPLDRQITVAFEGRELIVAYEERSFVLPARVSQKEAA